MTKRLIELHGGRIRVESDGIEGKGSRFTFLLPLPKPAVTPAGAADDGDVSGGALRPLILVVAEEEQSRLTARNYLVEVGYRVSIVAEPARLVETLKGNRPYAVVFDEKFAGQRSEQELCELRSQIPATIPIAICSIDADREARIQAVGRQKYRGVCPEVQAQRHGSSQSQRRR